MDSMASNLVASLLLVAMHLATRSFLLLVAMPGAPSSFLLLVVSFAPSSDALATGSDGLQPTCNDLHSGRG